jgi:hypothetical protein
MPGTSTPGTVDEGPLLAVKEAQGRDRGTDLLQRDPQGSKRPRHCTSMQDSLLEGRPREHPPQYGTTGGEDGIQ